MAYRDKPEFWLGRIKGILKYSDDISAKAVVAEIKKTLEDRDEYLAKYDNCACGRAWEVEK